MTGQISPSANPQAHRSNTSSGLPIHHKLLLGDRFVKGIAASFWYASGVVVTVTVAMLLFGSSAIWAIGAGIGALLLIALFNAALMPYLETPQQALPCVYESLLERFEILQARFNCITAPHQSNINQYSAYAEVSTHCDWLSRIFSAGGKPEIPPGLMGTAGCIEIDRRIHRAEEALVEIDTREALMRYALDCEARIKGSTLARKNDLLEQIKQIKKELTSGDALPNPLVRANLRQVSTVIHQFRDERTAALVRTCNSIHRTGIVTGLVMYGLLCAVALQQIKPDYIFVATVVYLIGAVASLFQRLVITTNRSSTVEDYGLDLARDLHTPLFAGLAALGGVLVLALAPTLLAHAQDPPSLASVFNISENPYLLITAAVFGLAPRLLIKSLGSVAESYKRDLALTQVSDGASHEDESSTEEEQK